MAVLAALLQRQMPHSALWNDVKVHSKLLVELRTIERGSDNCHKCGQSGPLQLHTTMYQARMPS